jgi:hypothetical protein
MAKLEDPLVGGGSPLQPLRASPNWRFATPVVFPSAIRSF